MSTRTTARVEDGPSRDVPEQAQRVRPLVVRVPDVVLDLLRVRLGHRVVEVLGITHLYASSPSRGVGTLVSITQHPTFSVLSPSQFDRLSELGEERTAAVGEHLFDVGDPSYPLIAIRAG